MWPFTPHNKHRLFFWLVVTFYSLRGVYKQLYVWNHKSVLVVEREKYQSLYTVLYKTSVKQFVICLKIKSILTHYSERERRIFENWIYVVSGMLLALAAFSGVSHVMVVFACVCLKENENRVYLKTRLFV